MPAKREHPTRGPDGSSTVAVSRAEQLGYRKPGEGPSEVPLTRRDRPRERLLEHGARTLADAELLAVLLRTGSRERSALELGREILAEAGGLTALHEADPSELRRRGVGPAKLASLLAALELGCRLARSELPRRLRLARPAATARYLSLRYGRLDQEVMGALYLDARYGLQRESELFRGTLTRASVEPRQILRQALICRAAGVIVFHNHPSGDPTPSAEDLAFTRRLSDALQLIGVELLDHLVLGGPERWISLRERGGW